MEIMKEMRMLVEYYRGVLPGGIQLSSDGHGVYKVIVNTAAGCLVHRHTFKHGRLMIRLANAWEDLIESESKLWRSGKERDQIQAFADMYYGGSLTAPAAG